jgi:phosphatidylglycerophosphate synthase
VLFRYQYHTTAFLLVVLHDFLDHVDGIVAKAHRKMFGQVDDPLLGGFMDAFCDKVFNFNDMLFNSSIKNLVNVQ